MPKLARGTTISNQLFNYIIKGYCLRQMFVTNNNISISIHFLFFGNGKQKVSWR